MSIGRRFWDVARSELNALLDKARELGADESMAEAEVEGDAPARPARGARDLSGFTDAELEAEIERRRLEHELRARTRAHGRASGARGSPAGAAAGARARAATTAPTPTEQRRRAYRALELPDGAPLADVKKAYRTLMRRYHPDRHAGAPDKQRAAHELATRLTEAYELLKRELS